MTSFKWYKQNIKTISK